eukprot:900416-Pyramimonas_sp.AAC.1
MWVQKPLRCVFAAAFDRRTVDSLSGWEYLIETGQFEELTTAQLEDYFVKYNLKPVPATKLEMIMQIKKHSSQQHLWEPENLWARGD